MHQQTNAMNRGKMATAILLITTLSFSAPAMAQSSRSARLASRESVSDSTHRAARTVKWAGIGAVSAAVVGWVATRNLTVGCSGNVPASGPPTPCNADREERHQRVQITVSAAAVGAVVGAAFGWFKH